MSTTNHDKHYTTNDSNNANKLRHQLANIINNSSDISISEKQQLLRQLYVRDISVEEENIDHHIDHGSLGDDYLVEFVLNDNNRYKFNQEHINYTLTYDVIESYFVNNNISPDSVEIIIITNKVKKVSNQAFRSCIRLKQIIFEPNEDIELGEYIIIDNEILTYIKLPNLNITNLNKIFGPLNQNTKIYYIQ